jgi:hypothetical protein
MKLGYLPTRTLAKMVVSVPRKVDKNMPSAAAPAIRAIRPTELWIKPPALQLRM